MSVQNIFKYGGDHLNLFCNEVIISTLQSLGTQLPLAGVHISNYSHENKSQTMTVNLTHDLHVFMLKLSRYGLVDGTTRLFLQPPLCQYSEFFEVHQVFHLQPVVLWIWLWHLRVLELRAALFGSCSPPKRTQSAPAIKWTVPKSRELKQRASGRFEPYCSSETIRRCGSR